MINKIVCAWCRRVLRDGVEPASHDICPTCLAKQLKEITPS